MKYKYGYGRSTKKLYIGIRDDSIDKILAKMAYDNRWYIPNDGWRTHNNMLRNCGTLYDISFGFVIANLCNLPDTGLLKDILKELAE